ncbi:MAG: chloride channel protein [Syntrophaceae bacterium]|nr:chloride channel protein [Syntrophaceae bacterium]
MKSIGRWIVLGMTVGVVSGLGAILFNYLLTSGTRFFMTDLVAWAIPDAYRSIRLLGFPLSQWLMIAIPALGGLISGFLVYRFAPEAEGHGTDAMIDSFHRKGGAVRPRVPVIKTVASAITIGSGGSAGKEGPIAQIGSGFASILATLLKMDEPSRRLMLLAGAAGGIGAIFKAPLGAALFATEVLYRRPEFEFEGIIPCILSSIVAFTVYTLYTGYGTIFTIPNLAPVTAPAELLLYGIFGILCAAVGYVYIRFFYGMRDLFAGRLRMNRIYRPAVGGLLLGVLAFFLPEVLGGGYGWIQSAIDGKMAMRLMIVLVFAKILSTSLTIGSGGSGGVFAPSLFIGAMLGGAYGLLCGNIFDQWSLHPGAFVLVGMGGFFAGVAKVPIAALIMVAEMTGGYNLIVPLMIVSTISYLLLGDVSLYEKQVPARIDSPAHLGDFAVDMLEHVTVSDAVPPDRKVETIPESCSFDALLQRIVDSTQSNFPVVDAGGRLTGILSISDVRRVMLNEELHNLVVAKDIATDSVLTVTPGDDLKTALRMMTKAEVRELPIVDPGDPQKLISMISRKDIIRTYCDQIERIKTGRNDSASGLT